MLIRHRRLVTFSIRRRSVLKPVLQALVRVSSAFIPLQSAAEDLRKRHVEPRVEHREEYECGKQCGRLGEKGSLC